MSIFSGKDEIIGAFLGLKDGEHLKQKAACRRLADLNRKQSDYDDLVRQLYVLLERNRRPREPSKENWRDSCQTDLNENNKSPEVLLERAVAILAKRGILPGWFNQMPVASGLVDGNADKRAAVDLARIEGHRGFLIELKWKSDTPAFAAFEILLYGLVYLYSYLNRAEFGYSENPLMRVKKTSLCVLAPKEYYAEFELSQLATGLDTAIRAFSSEVTNGSLVMDYGFRSFPENFELPFETGSQATALMNLPVDDQKVLYLVKSIAAIEPAF